MHQLRRGVRLGTARRDLVALVAGVMLGLGCSGTGGAGCAALGPIPSGRFAGPKNDNAINVRLSANGVNYLNSNWPALIGMFAPSDGGTADGGATLNLPVPCSVSNVPLVGDVVIADQGAVGCSAESCGLMDGVCDAKDVPKNVVAHLTGFSLVPKPPDSIEATIQMTVDTGDLYVDTVDRSIGACVWLSGAKCSVRFWTADPQDPVNTDNRLKATVKFTVDSKWDKMTAFSVTSLGGTDVCGASGAPPKPNCLDPRDISIDGRNNCGDVYCGVADWDPLKTLVLQLISPMLQTQIQAMLATQACEACGTGLPACPSYPVGCTGAACSAVSTCQNKVCMDSATSKCVPRFLGVEGRMSLGATLATFGAPEDAALDLSVGLGSSVRVDQGISLGTRAGLQAVTVSPCVPPLSPPAITAVNAPDFDAEASPGSLYHVGLGLSSNFLNISFHQAHQSGALCLQLSTANVGLINTGLFKTFLPSLGKLATRDGKDAPMMVVLRPAKAPTVTVGLGTYDPVTKKPIKPLLLVTLPDISIDFYALIDDRYARLFTLTADISLPLSLIFEGCDKVTPAIGDLRQLITNIRTANSEMLAEDPRVLSDLIPAVIGLAEPAVASGLKPFALPPVGAFKLKVNEIKGIGNIAGTEAYNHLGIYAQLMSLTAACAVSAPQTVIVLKNSLMPKAEDMRLTGKPLPWPKAVLGVQAIGKEGSPEYSVKVDEGLWSDFIRAKDETLIVEHPAFLMQGLHRISVRSRVAEDPHGISAVVQTGFRVDWEPPELSLTPDRTGDRLVISARDVVSADDALQFAYAIGTGAFSAFGERREIALTAVEQQGGVRVRVKDEMGNVAEAAWKVPEVALRAEATPDDPAGARTRGCSAVGGLELLGLAALLGLRRRR